MLLVINYEENGLNGLGEVHGYTHTETHRHTNIHLNGTNNIDVR